MKIEVDIQINEVVTQYGLQRSFDAIFEEFSTDEIARAIFRSAKTFDQKEEFRLAVSKLYVTDSRQKRAEPQAGERWVALKREVVHVTACEGGHVRFETDEHQYGESLSRFLEQYERDDIVCGVSSSDE